MSLPREGWSWWGEAGGTRLDVKRVSDDGIKRIEFKVTTPNEIASVTLATFRVDQLKDWLRDEGDEAKTWHDLYLKEQQLRKHAEDGWGEAEKLVQSLYGERNVLQGQVDDASRQEWSAAFTRGVESVTCIRCVEHRAVPLINTNEAAGGECGACIKAELAGQIEVEREGRLRSATRSPDADALGREVRETWLQWAKTQPDVAQHPSWLVPWDELPERDKRVDRFIAIAVVNAYLAPDEAGQAAKAWGAS